VALTAEKNAALRAEESLRLMLAAACNERDRLRRRLEPDA
jgi:hypothetical protein